MCLATPEMPTLSWDEFARDLRLARHWTDQVYVHSLEGCVQQGFLGRLLSFDWSEVSVPPPGTRQAQLLRGILRGVLWVSAHPALVATAARPAAAGWISAAGRRTRSARVRRMSPPQGSSDFCDHMRRNERRPPER